MREQPESEPATPASKANMDSLPDEILEGIVEELAGDLVYDEDCQGYARHYQAISDLRYLRLVNRRFSRIAQDMLYRAPSTMTRSQRPLTRKDLDLLTHRSISEAARMLSLAGSSTFFAQLLKARFCGLTSLTLVFSKTLGEGKWHDECFASESLAHLRTTLQALLLRELYIDFEDAIGITDAAFSQCVLLAAGHATLRHLSMDAVYPEDIEHTGHLAAPISETSSLTSLHLSAFYEEHALILRNTLGSLPHLAELSIDNRSTGPGDLAQMLDGLGFISMHSVTCFNIAMEYIDTDFWKMLAILPNLRDLKVQSVEVEDSDIEFDEVILPRLETIHIECLMGISVNTAVTTRCAQRQYLPSLKSIHLVLRDDCWEDWEGDDARDLLVACDELKVANPGVTVSPDDIREEIVQRLEDLKNSSFS